MLGEVVCISKRNTREPESQGGISYLMSCVPYKVAHDLFVFFFYKCKTKEESFNRNFIDGMRLLIISENIAPYQAIGSIRWTKIGKYLSINHGAEVSILTNEKKYEIQTDGIVINRIDKKLEEDLHYFSEYHAVKCGKLFDIKNMAKIKRARGSKFFKEGYQSSIEKGTEKGNILASVKRFLLVIAERSFENLVSRYISKYAVSLSGQYDAIITTFSTIWPLLTACKYKKRNKSTLWIADFRDPYARLDRDSEKIFKNKNIFLRRKLKDADVILKVNETMHIYGDELQPVLTVPNGYDPQEAAPPLSPEIFDFLFTGILYGYERDLRPLFRAVIELIDEKKIDGQDVRFTYAGRKKREFEKQAADVPEIIRYCRIFEEIPRSEVLKLQQKCAFLINGGTNYENNEVRWSGKMYEYMMARKPIIMMMSGMHSEFLMENVPKCGGVVYEKCNHDPTFNEMKEYILKKYCEWKETGNITIERDEDYVAQFSYPVIADKVWEIIESM